MRGMGTQKESMAVEPLSSLSQDGDIAIPFGLGRIGETKKTLDRRVGREKDCPAEIFGSFHFAIQDFATMEIRRNVWSFCKLTSCLKVRVESVFFS